MPTPDRTTSHPTDRRARCQPIECLVSSLLAAGNAAVYVAQIEDARMTETVAITRHSTSRAKLRRHGGLWFNDGRCVIARRPVRECAATASLLL